MELSRRACLAFAAAAPWAGGAHAAATPSLESLAKAKGVRFGSSVGVGRPGNVDSSFADLKYRDLLVRECGIIVPENELKLYAIQPRAGAFDFGPADQLAAFAKAHGMRFRGHNLLWNRNEFAPSWLPGHDFGGRAGAERWLNDYIAAVAGRYRGQVESWDVVNETIDPATGAIRDTVFTRAMGPQVVELAFHAARQADPTARLVYNDYMGWGPGDAKHRAGVLKLLERLKASGAPVQALGVQSHIANGDAGNVVSFSAADQREWRRFLDEVRGMGLDLLITEFDVNDTVMPADVAKRDALVAGLARDYLDLMLSYSELKQILAWGLVDKYSWLQTYWPRPDHIAKRPTLYDAQYRPKPLRESVAAALRAAPPRQPWA